MSIKTLQIPQNLPAPQPRYRGLTLPKLRLGWVKLVVFREKCQFFQEFLRNC